MDSLLHPLPGVRKGCRELVLQECGRAMALLTLREVQFGAPERPKMHGENTKLNELGWRSPIAIIPGAKPECR